MDLVKKWKTCPKFKNNILYGSVSMLSGCVAFWNLRCHKLVREVNEEYSIMTPEQLNTVAWGVNGVFKAIGTGLWIKALIDYKKCG